MDKDKDRDSLEDPDKASLEDLIKDTLDKDKDLSPLISTTLTDVINIFKILFLIYYEK
jgi:hypothetical protein